MPRTNGSRRSIEDLTTRGRIEVAEKIERAREEGDLSENAGYHAAKDEQGHMEGRIRQLEHMLEDAEIVDDQFVYTVLYDGDSPDQAERYVVGHLEEQVEDATLVSPIEPARHCACRARPRGSSSATRRRTERSR